MDEAYVSLTTNDDYAQGALVLGKSLRNTKTTRKLALMVTSGVSKDKRNQLNEVWDVLIDVTLLDSEDKENLVLLSRPELGCTFSKLRAWTLTQFKKCVFLDADTLVLQNVDDLFEREELSAAADVGWPDCFNSGVFVFKPDLNTYNDLLKHAKTHGSFDGGDQGLLNEYFSDWAASNILRHLPFIYNMVSSVTYSYAPAFKRFGLGAKIVHFLGSVKPWHHHYNPESEKVVLTHISNPSQSDLVFVQMWWDLFGVAQKSGIGAGSTGQSSMPQSWQKWQQKREPQTPEDRKTSWERGNPDYTGEDGFDKILNHMSNIMLKNNATAQQTSSVTPSAAGTSSTAGASASAGASSTTQSSKNFKKVCRLS